MTTINKNFINLIEKFALQIISLFFLTTLLITFTPLVFEDPGVASLDPKKEAYQVQEQVNEKFVESVQWVSMIVDSNYGDVTDKKSLLELLQNQNKLIQMDEKQQLVVGTLEKNSYFWQGYNEVSKTSFKGIYSFANIVDETLKLDPRFPNGLNDATENDVKIAISRILDSKLLGNPKDVLSSKAKSEKRTLNGEEIDYWTSPGIFIEVLSDNLKLGGGNFGIELGAGETALNKERYSRKIIEILNGENENFKIYGIAVDVNLEAADEGSIAGLFITATVIAAIAIAGIFLRSYWAMVLVGIGLIMLMILLKGFSVILGFKGGLISDLIVPIAMVSLGVDFAIHALKRMQEERKRGDDKFFFFGMSGVLGALTLALLTDSTAFIANAFAGVESVLYFGLAATLATFLSYLVLGILVPLAYSKIIPLIKNERSLSEKIIRQINFLTTPILSGTAVISVVVFGDLFGSDFIAMLLGFAISLLILFLNILLPIYLNKKSSQGLLKKEENYQRTFDEKLAKYFFLISKRYYIVLPISIVITVFAAIGALNLKSEFDVKDFFDNKSDFVIGLDKFLEYSSGSRGEPAQILFEGDITNPEFFKKFHEFKTILSEVEFIGLNEKGDVNQEGILNPIKVSKLIFDNPKLKEKIETTQNIKITDANNDQIPDSNIQIEEILKYGFKNGLSEENKFSYDPRWFQRYFWFNEETNDDFTTVFLVLLSESESEDDVEQVRKDIKKTIEEVNFSENIKIGITGSPFSRNDQLNASTDAMRRSIPIAAGGSFLIILIILRSFRYAIATIIPIGLVVVWLYGIMYIFNFSLNYVTATIGAISLGVGVDFSIHMTMRFREEIKKRPTTTDALFRSINGTGMALLASAASSILGFAIMGFAPMPLFSTFGILTSIMIFLALTVSLFVLPSLLMLINISTKKRTHVNSS